MTTAFLTRYQAKIALGKEFLAALGPDQAQREREMQVEDMVKSLARDLVKKFSTQSPGTKTHEYWQFSLTLVTNEAIDDHSTKIEYTTDICQS